MSWFKHEQKGEKFAAAGKLIQCPHCGGEEFLKSEAQLHTQGLTFLQLEWLGQSVSTLLCTRCSNLIWFGQAPEGAA
jgi:hypothetical protein